MLNLTDEEREALQREGSRLDRLLTASMRSARPLVEPPRPGSAMDLANKAGVRETFDMAYGLIFAAEDHFRSLMLILRIGPLPGFSLYSLLRPAMEAAVRCHHLLDPDISEQLRLARGLNERLDNLEEQLKVDRKDPGTAAEFFSQRVARLEQRAKDNDIQVLRRRKPPHTIHAFGEPRPNDIDLFAAYLPGGAGATAFRFLSGHVHSKFWVWVRGDRAFPSKEPGVALVSTEVNVLVFAAMLKAATDLHDSNLGNWLTLAGYQPEVWTAAKQTPPSR